MWVVTGNPGNVGKILHWDGTNFTVEHEGGVFTDIWGFGGTNPHTMYAVGDRIVQRGHDGTWQEVVSPDDVPAVCHDDFDLLGVVGRNPNDVWVVGFSPCILHYDGKSWTEIARPDNATRLGGVWALDAKRILVAGQGGADQEQGLISLWSSVDGGASWTQFSDPVFTGIAGGFFDLAATTGGQRIYAPRISGWLLIGTPGGGANTNAMALWTSRVSVASGSPRPGGSGEVILPEQ